MMSQAHPAADLFPLLDGPDLEGLVESIRKHGYDARKPVVRYRGVILDGRNRERAAKIAGVVPSYIDAPDDCDPWLESWKHNGARRNLEATQKVAIYMKIKDGSEEWAAERERKREEANEARAEASRIAMLGNTNAKKTGAVSRDTGPVSPPKLAPSPAKREEAARSAAPPPPPRPPTRTRDDIAKATGVSSSTVARVQKVQADAPEKFDAVARGEMSAGDVLKIVKQEKKHALAEELRAAPLPAPKGPYRVIVIDPPWRYEKRAEDITHRGRNPYPDMSTEEICALPVGELAEDNAILWLWTTNAFMRAAYQCLDAWGFQERTILTWCKDRMGTGDWLRGKTEHAILAIRGRPMVTLTNQTTELRAALREHSRKPDEFYSMVEALCPGTKLEMFAREARAGWGAWGAETGAFDVG